MMELQRKRFASQLAFFVIFVLAPPLDIFRLDLNLKHLILFGHDWTLGLDAFLAGQAGVGNAVLNLLLRGLFPIVLVVGGGVWVSWKYGRLYCGWLCPHFSVVELINGLMRRASGKPSLWEPAPLPERLPDGRILRPDVRYWGLVIPAIVGFAFLWALTLLTYLLPPAEIYGNLMSGSLTRNQAIFLAAGTVVFAVEFLLARHLFCRFGCAVGLFQSLAWMANKRAVVVGFDRARVKSCASCNAACDNACPMRLKPRSIKRHMFACTQCGQCVTACGQVQSENPEGSLLQWLQGDCALDVSDRDFGRHRDTARDCFKKRDAGVKSVRVVPEVDVRHCPPECYCRAES